MQDNDEGGFDPTSLSLSYPNLILLHLSEFQAIPDHLPAPKNQTQDGMSKSLEKAIPTISKGLSQLQENNLVTGERRRVEGEKGRRRMVYWLTAEGESEVGRRMIGALRQRSVCTRTSLLSGHHVVGAHLGLRAR